MRGLESLSPDQRAVLQLILRQGRGYTDLAGMLKIDVAAVRDRAHAGLAALGGPAGETLTPERRARIADYVLGQQDDAERIVTLAQLGDSPAAADWARTLRAQLAPLASGPLPEVPSAANGAANGAGPPVGEAPGARRPPTSAGPRPSRLGGAVLLGAIGAALVAVLLVVLLSGGSAKRGAATTAASPTSAATQPSATSTTQTTPAAPIVAQVNLTSPIGGQAIGIGFVQQSGATRALAVQAQHLAANGAQDAYAMWLQGPSGSKLLGFVPQKVGKEGTFAVSAQLPADAKTYTKLLVTKETTSASTVPAQPGTVVLSGAMTLP